MPFVPLNSPNATPTPSFSPLTPVAPAAAPKPSLANTTVEKSFQTAKNYDPLSPFKEIIKSAVDSFNSGVHAVNTIINPKSRTPVGNVEEGLNAGLGLASAVGGVIFSPVAPITNKIGQVINAAGEGLAHTPYFEGYSKDVANLPTQDTNTAADRILNVLSNAGNVANALLGTKANEITTPEASTKIPVQSDTTTHSIPVRTVEPPLPVVVPKAESAPTPVATPTTPPKVGRTTQTLKPIEGTGDLKTRGLAQGVEATAIEKKLADNFGQLPEYRQVNMKEQAQQAADLFTRDPESARAIAMGDKAAPKGLLPESVFVAAEHDATTRGDVQMLKDLANSKLAGSATTMGQRIRALGERDSASPLAAIQEVQKARTEAQAQRGLTAPKVIEKVRTSIRKVNTKENWSDFVNSITC